MQRKVITACIVLVSLIVMSFSGWHKYYVSVTEVNYAEKEQSLQITTRVFYDDLEKVLQERYDESVKVESSSDKKVDFYIEKYFKKKLEIVVNGKVLELQFLGRELEDDLVYCYLEVKDVSKINSISVKNKLLFDVFEEQQNIVHVNIKPHKKSFLLVKERDQGVLKF